MVALLAAVAVVALVAGSASAGLTVDIVSGTYDASHTGTNGGSVAINSGTTSVTLAFWANVTGTNGATSDDGLNGFLASFYSTKSVATNAPYTLSKGNLGWSSLSDLSKFNGSGTATPVQKDLDLDGDLDLGATSLSIPTGWFSADGGTGGGPGGLTYYSGPQHFGTLTYTQTAFDSGSRGITQIYAKTQKAASTVYEQDGVVKSAIDSANTQRVTLYAVSVPDAGSDQNAVVGTLPSSISLNGSASTGSMNEFIWEIFRDGGWHLLSDGAIDNVNLPWATLGLDIHAAGDFPIRLTTKYTGAGINAAGGNGTDNSNSDQFLLQITPEPGTALFLVLGGMGMAWFRRRKAAKA